MSVGRSQASTSSTLKVLLLLLGGAPNVFFNGFGNGSHFWAQSQEDLHVDAIGYKRRTSEVVVGAKCQTVMLKWP